MEQLLFDILDRLRANPSLTLDAEALDGLIRTANRGIHNNRDHVSKKKFMSFYLDVKAHDPKRWCSWNIDAQLEQRLLDSVRLKPRRTASGVATITVITRPEACSGNCIFCPSDVRMPKSYLHREPACQRAEQALFDPYIQVHARMKALSQMGHPIDKIELIVLGGTWSDYPKSYQIWFVKELFRAINEWPATDQAIEELRQRSYAAGMSDDSLELERRVASTQAAVDAKELSYNQAIRELYAAQAPKLASFQTATLEELAHEQHINEQAAHRVVGLVVETRPDAITAERLLLMRQLGCTKIQVGIQSTRQDILDKNGRAMSIERIKQAFDLLRLFGFKIHSHLMLNLIGSTPKDDIQDFATFVGDKNYLPDEIKLYPCALVPGTRLVEVYERGLWRPYTAEELIDVLVADVMATPCYVRISRMIRDIDAEDILVGNKHANLRQMVDEAIEQRNLAPQVQEIRFREIARAAVDLTTLTLQDYTYETHVTQEHFLQWVTPDNHVAGFLRLSCPAWDKIAHLDLPTKPHEAMIREVHVYGSTARLGHTDASAQHQGLGKQLVERACAIAQAQGYVAINVISSVGTRGYYRSLGFSDNGLYQRRSLN
ncbi:MAG: elongator complex protein 3 [Atopobiaceae bacterium]|jgi:elongator complex protein 3